MTTPDAILLLSYGAPECKEDVLAFLENLFAGKNVSEERIRAAAEKYDRFARQTGRFSPLNEECRALIDGILHELNSNEKYQKNGKLPAVYWGNLFWHPMLEDTMSEMARDGIKQAVCFATSPFDSGATDRRYDAALETASKAVDSKSGPNAPKIERLPLPFDHPLFIEAQTDRLLEALAWAELNHLSFETAPIVPNLRTDIKILFSAHSIPTQEAEQSQYVKQLRQTCEAIIEQCSPVPPWELVFQSRSGRSDDWIGPDIRDRVRQIAQNSEVKSIVVSPIGFFCENMETAGDIDLEIGAICEEFHLDFVRAQAVGALPKICRMICESAFGETRPKK